MKKRHIISLSGDLASGKGETSKVLMKELNYTIYRNGEYVRKLAREKGLSITDFNQYLSKHPEIDRQIEQSAAEYGKTHDNFIIDARLGWYAIPESFKVYLKVDIDVAAKRAFNDPNRKSSENLKTIEDQKQDMLNRFKMENERYYEIYKIRKDDMSNYDLVVDTTNITPEETAKIIKDKYLAWLNE